MVFAKPQYFNIYRLLLKLLALLVLCIFPVSCNKKETQAAVTPEKTLELTENALNINTATVQELEKLPNVGAKLAERIVEHRDRYGKFRKPEHLILVQGISDKRFRQMQNLVKTE